MGDGLAFRTNSSLELDSAPLSPPGENVGSDVMGSQSASPQLRSRGLHRNWQRGHLGTSPTIHYDPASVGGDTQGWDCQPVAVDGCDLLGHILDAAPYNRVHFGQLVVQ